MSLAGTARAETTIAFGPAVEVPAVEQAVEFAVGDLDGDGAPDLVLLQSGSPGHLVLLRSEGADGPPGNLAFEAPVLIECGPSPSALRIADLNGDHKPELVVGVRNGVALFENRAAPGRMDEDSFAAPVVLTINPLADPHFVVYTDVEVADCDGDGAVDLLARATLFVAWRNVGGGQPLSSGSWVREGEWGTPTLSITPLLETADIDGDGRPDVRTGSSPGWLLNVSSEGSIQFTNALAARPVGMLGDVDSDGLLDDISGGGVFPRPGEAPKLYISRNTSSPGQPQFATNSTLDVVNDDVLGLYDLDGDGRSDWLFWVSSNRLGVVRNVFLPGLIGSGELDPPAEWEIPIPAASNQKRPGAAAALGFADLDGNRLPEAISLPVRTNVVIVLPNRTQVEPEVQLTIPARTQRQLPGSVVEARVFGFHLPGEVDRCELFEGTNRVAAFETLPVTSPVTLGSTGILSFRAEAVTSAGTRITSRPVTVLVSELGPSPINVAPSVRVTHPASGLRYYSPASFDVEAEASDTDGLVDEVELLGVFLTGRGLTTNRLARWTTGPYRYSITNADVALRSVFARATDNSGTRQASSPIGLIIYSGPSLSYVPVPTDALPNPRTGFLEQAVTFQNQSSFAVTGVRLFVEALPPDCELANATGSDGGVPFVQHDPVVPPGGRLTFTLEYRLFQGAAMPQPRFRAAFVTPGAAPAWSGELMEIRAWSLETQGSWYLEFPTEAGRRYGVQYSSNLVEWASSQPAQAGDGLPAKWLDQGPPRTTDLPGAQPQRFYRVLRLP